MSSSIYDAVCESPADDAGRPIGDGDWRVAVQMLIASGGARVGKCRVGHCRVSDYQWIDLNDWSGLEWTRGAPPVNQSYPRANVGVLNMVLDNNDEFYTSYNNNVGTVAVGTRINTETINREWTTSGLLRVVVFLPGETDTDVTPPVDNIGYSVIDRVNWYPRFTGRIESWIEAISCGINQVHVTAIETLSDAAAVTVPEGVPVNTGDATIGPQAKALMDAIGWPFPVVAGALQPTLTFPQVSVAEVGTNVLAGLQLMGDSVEAMEMFSDTDGSLRIGLGAEIDFAAIVENTPPAYEGPILILTSSNDPLESDTDYFPEAIIAQYNQPLEISNNSDFVLNDCTVDSIGFGGTRVINDDSVALYGRRTFSKTGLLSGHGFAVAETAFGFIYYNAGTDPYGIPAAEDVDQTLQPGVVTLTDKHEAQRALTLGDFCIIDRIRGDAPHTRFHARITHTHDVMTPLRNSVQWTTDISARSYIATQPIE